MASDQKNSPSESDALINRSNGTEVASDPLKQKEIELLKQIRKDTLYWSSIGAGASFSSSWLFAKLVIPKETYQTKFVLRWSVLGFITFSGFLAGSLYSLRKGMNSLMQELPEGETSQKLKGLMIYTPPTPEPELNTPQDMSHESLKAIEASSRQIGKVELHYEGEGLVPNSIDDLNDPNSHYNQVMNQQKQNQDSTGSNIDKSSFDKQALKKGSSSRPAFSHRGTSL